MKRTLIVFLLVLAMVLQLVPFSAFAAEEEQAEIVAEVEEVTEPVEEEPAEEPTEEPTEEPAEEPAEEPTEEATEAPTEPVESEIEDAPAQEAEVTAAKNTFNIAPATNPLYPELARSAKSSLVYGEFDREAEEAEAIAYNNVADAVQYITACMEQRKTYFTFEMNFSYQPGSNALGDALLDWWYAAMEHNGNPTQGDYLKWHWLEVDPWEDSYFYDYSNGTCKLVAVYHADYYTTASQESALTTRVNQILNSFNFNAATTDYEKAYTIYNWVTTNIRYDHTGLNNKDKMAHTAYKGIMQGTCVCQGYASIIYRMYLQVGVPCRVVAGDSGTYTDYNPSPDDSGDNHGWNIAYILGKWYNLDSTWDEGVAASNWQYFLKSPNGFPYHYRWSEYNTSNFHKYHPMASSNFNPGVYNGIVQINGYWGYYVNGFLQRSYTGLVSHNGVLFYVQNGILDMNYTSLGYHNGEWYYIQNGVYKNDYTGLVFFDNNWFYVAGGKLDFSYTGLVNYYDTWYYVENGKLNLNYTGLAQYNGVTFYVINGVMDFSYTGLAYYRDEWRYVANSQLTDGYTGLVYFNNNWFYTVNSRIDWTFTGLVPFEGNYFYVQNNLLDWSYTGLGYHDGGWYYIENGLFKQSYNSLVYFNDNWFYMESGRLTFSYTGLVPYNGNYFYVRNSAVDWSYTGYVFFHGTYYYVDKGLMVW